MWMQILMLAMILFSTSAHAQLLDLIYRPQAKALGDQFVEFKGELSYFSTLEHLDASGDGVALVNQEAYQMAQGMGQIRYGINRHMDVGLGARYRSNRSVRADGQKESVSNIESLQLETQYSFDPVVGGPTTHYWAFKCLYRQALYSNEIVQTEQGQDIVLGDDGKTFALGVLWGGRYEKNLHFSTGVLYAWPDNLSEELNYHGEVAYRFTRLAVMAGVEGIATLSNDEYSEVPEEKPKIERGSTYLWNSINRAQVTPVVGFDFLLGKATKIYARYRTTAVGQSTDRGNEYLVGLVYQRTGKTQGKVRDEDFKEYDFEASVIKVSPRQLFFVIDKGELDDAAKGMVLDIFKFDYQGGNILVATGRIFELENRKAVVKVESVYQDLPIQVGFVVRGRVE